MEITQPSRIVRLRGELQAPLGPMVRSLPPVSQKKALQVNEVSATCIRSHRQYVLKT